MQSEKRVIHYNLLSVSKASEAGKSAKFDNIGCEILNGDNKVIAFATRVGNLYYLEFCRNAQRLNVVEEQGEIVALTIWAPW